MFVLLTNLSKQLWRASRVHTAAAITASALIVAGCAPAIRETASAFKISAGASQAQTADHLIFLVQPSNAMANIGIAPSITVAFVNQLGIIDTSATGTVNLAIAHNPSAGTLSGSLSMNATAGVVSFTGLTIDISGTGYTLAASSGTIVGATSSSFNITGGVPTQLVFSNQPSSAASGASLGNVSVTVEDVNGNKVTSSSAPITLSIANNAGPGGVLSGTVTINAVNGVATLPGLNINLAGTGYTLAANSPSLTGATSSGFNITASSANKLAFTTQPTNAASGASLGSIAVTVEDSAGNKVSSSTASITLAIANNAGPGGVLSGTMTVSAVAGVATFPGLSINLDGTGYTLSVTASSLTSATSSSFNISASGPTQLVFSEQPASAVSGASLGSIQVTVEDADGNTVTSSSASVTLAIGNNAGPGGVLSGTATASAVNGIATFSGLSINLVGTGYTLSANSTSLAQATSAAFNISVGAASQVIFSSQPSSAGSGVSLGTITAIIEDAAGNKVTSSAAPVTLAIGTNAGPGGTLSGTATSNAVAGVATFSGLSIDVMGTGYTLTASSGVLTGAISTAFNITAGPATQLVFSIQPASTTAGLILDSGTGVAVKVEDAHGNVVTGSSASIALTLSSNTLNGTTTVSASSGVATFADLSINHIMNGYTLTATSSGLTQAVSSSFNITIGPPAQLGFTVEPTNAVAGQNIGGAPGFQVSVEDAGGNLITSSTISITLSIGSGPGTLHGTLSSSAVSGVATFTGIWLDLMGAYTLNATSSSISGTSSSFNISPAPPTVVILTQEWPFHVVMNGCDSTWDAGDGALNLTTQDIYTNVSPVTTNTAFNLSSTGSTTFYAGQYGNNSCTSSIGTSVTLLAGQSTVYVAMIDTAMEAYTVTASNTGWVSGSVSTSSETSLTVTAGPSTIYEGTCNLYTITNEDAFGNPVSMGNGMIITFSGGAPYAGTSPTNGFYGTDSTCTSGTMTLNVPNGQSQVSFYFDSTVAGFFSWDTQSSTGLPQDNRFAFTVLASLTQERTAIEGPSIITPGVCSSAFKVTALDSGYNQMTVPSNVTVVLSTTGSTQFFSDPGCGTALPSNHLTISASSGSQLFYVKTAASETATLTSTVSGNLSTGSFKLRSTSSAQTLIVAEGWNMVCYALNGAVSCWGRNENGQLGNGTNTDSATPVSTGLTGVTSIAASGEGVCAVNSAGLWCWGSNYGSGLGLGSVGGCSVYNYYDSYPSVPVQCTSGVDSNVTSVTGRDDGDGFCVIDAGVVSCWRIWAYGPTPVSLPRPAVSVAFGSDDHACAILDDGTVYCWGSNGAGELGNGTTTDSSTPVQALGISGGATSLAAGNGSTCALVGGSLYCWGALMYGNSFGLTPTNQSISGVVSVSGAAGEYGIIKSDGSIWYTGTNGSGGYPGDGTFNHYAGNAFTETDITSGATGLDVGGSGVCAVVSGAGGQPSLQCWSDGRANTYSLVGDGSVSADATPFWTFSLN